MYNLLLFRIRSYTIPVGTKSSDEQRFTIPGRSTQLPIYTIQNFG